MEQKATSAEREPPLKTPRKRGSRHKQREGGMEKQASIAAVDPINSVQWQESPPRKLCLDSREALLESRSGNGQVV